MVDQGRLSGRTAVITGAGRGIGQAIAEAYAAEGAVVVLAARTAEDIERLGARIIDEGGRALAVATDVTHDAEVARLAEQTVEAFGAVHIVVNSAGTYKPGRFLDYNMADFERIMAVNFFGTVRVIQAFLPKMVEAGYGKIVNIASTAGKYGSLFQSPYNASKHAVVGLTRCLGIELAATGVKVNAICPGFVDTPMVDGAKPVFADIMGVPEDQVMGIILQRVPMGRLLKPEEIAHLAVYLASAESDGMTGQSLTISGGLILV